MAKTFSIDNDGYASAFVCTPADELANIKFDTCPFCGHEPTAKRMDDANKWFVVRCINKSCGVLPVAFAKTVGELAINWNARPNMKFDPPPPDIANIKIDGEPDANTIDKLRQSINQETAKTLHSSPYSEDFYRKVLAVILDAQARGALRF